MNFGTTLGSIPTSASSSTNTRPLLLISSIGLVVEELATLAVLTLGGQITGRALILSEIVVHRKFTQTNPNPAYGGLTPTAESGWYFDSNE